MKLRSTIGRARVGALCIVFLLSFFGSPSGALLIHHSSSPSRVHSRFSVFDGVSARNSRALSSGWENRGRRTGDIKCILQAPTRYTSEDWIENLKSLPRSRIAKNIRGHLLANTGWAFLVSIIHEYGFFDLNHVSTLPHSMMASALGLLLVFRTNADDRFWEARKIWGSVVNTSRNIARVSQKTLDKKHHARMAQLLGAFPLALQYHLQCRMGEQPLSNILGEEEAKRFGLDVNPPVAIAEEMTEVTNQDTDEADERMYRVNNHLYLQQQIGELINYVGMCERILLTPVPLSYSRHTSRFLSLYCLTLPVVLVPQLQFFTAPTIAMVCWGLFSIEEIGHFIEEPFSPCNNNLKLDSIVKKIRLDVKRLLKIEDNTPPPPVLHGRESSGETGGAVFNVDRVHTVDVISR